MTLVIVIVAVVVVALIVGLIARTRRSGDTVDSFRRGLDALSPEARRPVIDQVQRVSRPEDEFRPEGDHADGHDDDGDEDGRDAPGDTRGT